MTERPQDSPPETRPLRSWRWMLPCGLLPLVLFLFFSALGGKACIQVLTGIQPFSWYEMALGAGYLLAYAAVTLLTPVFVLAAGLICLVDLWREKAGSG